MGNKSHSSQARTVKFLKTEPEVVKWLCTLYSPDAVPPWIPEELKVYPEVVEEVPLDEELDEVPLDEVPTQVVPTQVPTRRPTTTTRPPTRPPTTMDNVEGVHHPTTPRGSPKNKASTPPSTPPSPSKVSGQVGGSSSGSGTKIPPVEVPPTDEVGKRELAKKKEDADRLTDAKRHLLIKQQANLASMDTTL